jgi:glycyl-tRNA synthetase
MAPSLPAARTKLPYPLYAADFDPSDPDLLLVGGGGGSSPTGVPNKLTLLDCSRSHSLNTLVDIQLSRTEDAVTSLAIAQSSDTSLTAYAGINSSTADQTAGRNEHLRSFRIDLPRKRKAGEGSAEDQQKDAIQGQTEALGRAQFFKVQKSRDQVYQRLVRLSPPSKDVSRPRITAIASGLAAESEIVLLKAGPAPGTKNEIARLNLGNKEAVDIDFAPAPGQGEEDTGMQYTMAYCTDYDVRLYRLAGGKDGVKTQMNIVHSTPEPVGKGARKPQFKGLRFLSPKHILLLQNLPGGKGVELLILRRHRDGTSAVISLQKRLSRNMKKATGLDVCILSESPIGDRQILVAVVGTPAIEILRMEFSKRTGMSSFVPVTVLKDVHSLPITRIVFSRFVPPVGPDAKAQAVKLASVSVDQDVVVHTFPLKPFPKKSAKAPRYVLVAPGNDGWMATLFSVFMAVLVTGIAMLCLQVFSEVRGVVPARLRASEWLPGRVQEMIGRPAGGVGEEDDFEDKSRVVSTKETMVCDLLKENEFYTAMLAEATAAVADLPSAASSAATALTDLIAEHAAAATEGAKQKAVVVRDLGEGLETDVLHDPAAVGGQKEEKLTKWEDLKESEKVNWRRRLSTAGHWTADQGESVLKGVLFSEMGAIAAQALG